MTERSPEATASLRACPYCGESVPLGAFCGNCGAHLADAGGGARLHHYAASPGEHVLRMAVVSTLFPRLPSRHAHRFRESFALGIFAVVLLCALRLYAPALITACVILPVLYLLYLYEVEIWNGRALTILVVTLAAGVLLGVGFSLGFAQATTATPGGTAQGVGFDGVLLPVVTQLSMLAVPLLWVSRRGRFDETLDGLSFGVTSALGFTIGSVLAEYWSTLTAPLVGASGVSTDEIVGILRAGIVAGVVNASTTGIILASVWLQRYGRSRHRHDRRALAIPAALLVGFGFQVGLGLAGWFLGSLLLDVLVWSAGAALLLVWLRVTVHHALLEEGGTGPVGADSACPECHHVVPTMLFCPNCGASRSAMPKHARPAIGAAQ